MASPLVSIVINNFNYERFVGDAIDSALNQTYHPIEIIVVDDGSTDGSRDVIARYGDRIVAILQPNGGQISAVNAGVAAASGEIIFILDSDDALRSQAAQEVVAAWQPGCSKIQFQLAVVDGDGRWSDSIFPSYPADLTPQRILEQALATGLYPCPPSSGNAYGHAFLERIMPLRIGRRHWPDGPINSVAPLYGEVILLNSVLGYYRIHGNNAWSQGDLRPDCFVDYIAHDLTRLNFMRHHAEQRGYRIVEDPLDRAVEHLQYRLASLKLQPERHPIPADTLTGLVRRAYRSLSALEPRLSIRFALLGWFVVVAGAPRPLARTLIALRYVPAQRPRLLRQLLHILRRQRSTQLGDEGFSIAPPAAQGGAAGMGARTE
jgi:glycosyltransferase involved in cell wall biosynthesis